MSSSSSHSVGIYENLPQRRQSTNLNARASSSRKSGYETDIQGRRSETENYNKFNNNNDRNFEEKPNNNDSWFSKSFVSAGGLVSHTSLNPPKTNDPSSVTLVDNNNPIMASGRVGGNPFMNLLTTSKNLNMSSSGGNSNSSSGGDRHEGGNTNNVNSKTFVRGGHDGSSSTQVKYRGCKTSPIAKVSEDWDFLTSLNDILRKENFLSESEQFGADAGIVGSSGRNYMTGQSRQNSISQGGGGGGINNSQVDGGQRRYDPLMVQIPSPRPPRPARRSDGRRKDFMKARSMNLDSIPLPHDILPPPQSFSNHTSSSNNSHNYSQDQQSSRSQGGGGAYRGTSPSPSVPSHSQAYHQQQQQAHQSYRNQYPSQHHGSSSVGWRDRSASPLPHQQHQQQQQPPVNFINNLPAKSCLSTTMSTSLDSIYDRLRSVDDYDQHNGYNKYFSQAPPYSKSKLGMGGGGGDGISSSRLISDMSNSLCSPYNSYMYTSNSNGNLNTTTDFENSLNNSSNWSHYKYPQDEFQFERQSQSQQQHQQQRLSQHQQDKNTFAEHPMNNYWMMPQYKSKSYGSLKGSLLGLDYEDRLLRLESDKDTLHLQVSVLSDQIDAQTSKIHDLEKLLDDKKNVLETTEEQLQRELITRSGLETQKLELMTEISGLRFKQATLERENLELKGQVGKSMTELNWPPDRIWDKPPQGPPLGVRGTSPALTAAELGQRLRLTSNDSGQNLMHHHQQRVQTPPANAYRRIDQSSTFGTLPRRSQPSALSTFNSVSAVHPVENSSKQNSLSSGNIHAITGNFNKANAEREDWQRGEAFNNYNNNSNTANAKGTANGGGGGHKPRRILRILGKLKRSNSGGLDNDVPETHGQPDVQNNPFARGGLRATAAPRLGWVKEQTPKLPERPIISWDSEEVVMWLNYLGLGMYANEIKRWVKSGQQLLDASPQELEKELNIKNALHRKKLNLALHYLKHPDEEDNAGKLDHGWVTRWLDDVGLPQYKESFSEARVDGRILSHLNSFDLISLKVTSLLHHASIKRGIQILRIHKFHPSCLCRRGSIAGMEINKDPKPPATIVATWTNHRVMEWLKAVDLAEYAPNLRGSGVHGALIVFEPRFNAELLATLLSIPSNKTLLRRHLSLQFNELVGKYIVQEKRLVEIAPDFIPINPTVKVKPQKKTQFPLRKKRFSNEFSEELLCPTDLNVFPSTWGSQTQLNSESYDSTGSFGAGGKVSNL